MSGVRVTIGREGEPLRRVPTDTISLQFQSAGRIEGSFSISPNTEEDLEGTNRWIRDAFCAEDKLQIGIEIDRDGVHEKRNGWCVITRSCANLATSISLGFSIVGRLA